MFRNWIHRKDVATLAAIREHLSQIEQALQQMTEKAAKNHIHIDMLHVHNPVLEKLEFRLDKLEIDELSGALNLGNNFGVRVHQKPPIEQKDMDEGGEPAEAQRSDSDAQEVNASGSTMNKTTKGFTFRFS